MANMYRGNDENPYRTEIDRSGSNHIPVSEPASWSDRKEVVRYALKKSRGLLRHIVISFRASGRSLSFEDPEDAARYIGIKESTLETYLNNKKKWVSRKLYNEDIQTEDVAIISIGRNDREDYGAVNAFFERD